MEISETSTSGERTVQPSSTIGSKPKTLPAGVSIETLGGIATPLLRKGTSLPATATQVFSTAEDKQAEVEVVLVFGDNRMARDNRLVGNFRLSGIPSAPKGIPQIRVDVSVDENMILTVTATDQATQRTKHLGARNLADYELPKVTDPLPSQTGSAQTKTEFGDLNDLFQTGSAQTKTEFGDLNDLFGGGGGGGFSDFYESLFGGMGANQSRPSQRVDATQAIEVMHEMTLEDAALGTRVIVDYQGKQYEVGIPPGVSTGTKVRFSPDTTNAPDQAIYIKIKVIEHLLFVRSGHDVSIALPVAALHMATGGRVRVPALKIGQFHSLVLPPRTPDGTTFRLEGKGMPDIKTKARGDLYVSIKTFDPRSVPPDVEERIRVIKQRLKGLDIEIQL